nr:hypothetical protein [Wadden Sea poxvirus]
MSEVLIEKLSNIENNIIFDEHFIDLIIYEIENSYKHLLIKDIFRLCLDCLVVIMILYNTINRFICRNIRICVFIFITFIVYNYITIDDN